MPGMRTCSDLATMSLRILRSRTPAESLGPFLPFVGGTVRYIFERSLTTKGISVRLTFETIDILAHDVVTQVMDREEERELYSEFSTVFESACRKMETARQKAQS